MRASGWPSSRDCASLKLFVTALLLCAAMATASQAQTLTTLHDFAGKPNDGANPDAGLVHGTDGNFYGTTYYGGSNNRGTAFKITPSGTLTVLHNFTSNGTDGCSPTAALVQGTDGDFYGTTSFCGSGSGGTVFKITSNGTLTALSSFERGGWCRGPRTPG